MPQTAAASILVDVVAFVRGADAVHSAKGALVKRLESHGAKVVPRLGKDVTHVIYERRHSQRPKDKAADEAELLDLYKRLDKYEYPPSVVSPLWLEESLAAGRRLVEKRYVVGRPKESLLAPAAPGSAGGGRKRRRAGSALPKPPGAYHLELGDFSSTQQIVEGDDAASAGARRGEGRQGSSPGQGAGGAGHDGKRRRAPAHSMGRGQRRGRGQLPAVQEKDAAEEVEMLLDGEADVDVVLAEERPGHCCIATSAAGLATQQAAHAMALELHAQKAGLQGGVAQEAGGEQGGQALAAAVGAAGEGSECDEDELDTPLSVRFARNSLDRSKLPSWEHGAWSADRRAGAVDTGGGRTAQRSRLARVSGPHHAPKGAGADVTAAGTSTHAAVTDKRREGGEPARGQELHASPAATAESEQVRQRAMDDELRRKKGVAARFSTRQLKQHLDKPLLLHKATPLPGAEPPPTVEAEKKEAIPVPVIERVESPWTLAAELPNASPPSQRQPRKSLLGPGGNDATPGAAGAPAPPPETLPSPWSTLRPWDKQAQQAGGALAASPVCDTENVPERERQEPQNVVPGVALQAAQQQATGARPEKRRTRSAHAGAAGAAGRSRTTNAAADAAPACGMLAVTSCDASMSDLARAATLQLHGMRLCKEGNEEGITHLVIGKERRTIKAMLAVAAGAWLVSPAWLTASLEAGRWLPEAEYQSGARFALAAARRRSATSQPPLLAGERVYVHLAKKRMASNAAALKRVAVALGAKLSPGRMCTLCVVVGSSEAPKGLAAGAACVIDEWLLLAAEHYELPDKDRYTI